MKVEKSKGRIFYDFTKWYQSDEQLIGIDNPSVQKLDNGIFLSGNTSDGKLYFPEIPALQNCTINLDVTTPTANDLGFAFRCSGIYPKNDTFAYIVSIKKDRLYLSRGSNISSSTGYYEIRGSSGDFTGRHILSLVLTGNIFEVKLDGVQKFRVSDNYYKDCGLFALRSFLIPTDSVIHSVEILSTEINDPLILDINRKIAVKFSEPINSYNLMNNLKAFTILYKQPEFINDVDNIIDKVGTLSDIAYAEHNNEKLLDTLILTLKKDDAMFLGQQLQVKYDSTKGDLYGHRTIDVLPSFCLAGVLENTGTNLPSYNYNLESFNDILQDISNMQFIPIKYRGVSGDHEIFTPRIETLATNTITIVGTIKP